MALHESLSSLEVPRSSIATNVARPRTLIWVRGEHDLATRSELSDTLAWPIAGEHCDVVVDLSLVTFMDASTVGVIVGARNLLGERSQKLTLRAPSHFARWVLDICGLSGLVEAEKVPSVTRTGALSSWVQVPAVDPCEAGSPPQPRPSVVQPQRPPPALLLPGS
jgi:anti-anti-sigma factor